MKTKTFAYKKWIRFNQMYYIPAAKKLAEISRIFRNRLIDHNSIDDINILINNNIDDIDILIKRVKSLQERLNEYNKVRKNLFDQMKSDDKSRRKTCLSNYKQLTRQIISMNSITKMHNWLD